MFRKLTFLVLALLLFAKPVLAEKIVFAVDATWPPMEMIDENRQIVGYSIDYMTAVGQEAGFTPEFRNTAWDGIFAGLAAGNYDAICSSVSITEERKKAMDFSIPYYEVKQGLVVPKDSAARTLEDLKGKTVGAQIGTTGYFAIQRVSGVNARSYDEIGLAMQDLYNGRIDGVVCDDPVAAQYALNEPRFSERLKLVSVIESDDPEYYGIAVQKGNERVLELINKGIQAVKDKGIEDELKAKWFGL
ncbi:basic amino acid ABC transporter substrate-binding protein [Desulfonatronovibrio hydrogenovorans]|uniref:basic amino acid ABC transporter substrate-binding protein n=1 Tax=Desulfonatronovibrio hydrogenovorans TaxID=53245 RepID=UPI00048FBB36|nr:basic amino acid ABC transporter substrate-binding protein [Desulfonatronovibrio hydrogenovorans]